jgi:hypothetical protein
MKIVRSRGVEERVPSGIGRRSHAAELSETRLPKTAACRRGREVVSKLNPSLWAIDFPCEIASICFFASVPDICSILLYNANH